MSEERLAESRYFKCLHGFAVDLAHSSGRDAHILRYLRVLQSMDILLLQDMAEILFLDLVD